jgi:hypothetical protein
MFPRPTTPAIDAIMKIRCDDQTGLAWVPALIWVISEVVFGISIQADHCKNKFLAFPKFDRRRQRRV